VYRPSRKRTSSAECSANTVAVPSSSSRYGKQHAVVRYEPLGARREVIEEEPRIERRLQRVAERRDAGQQIREDILHRRSP
jgi:hypothetical protein